MKIKKFLSLFLIAFVALLLAACGKKTQAPTSGTSKTPTSATTKTNPSSATTRTQSTSPTIEHMSAFVVQIDADAQLRNYNEAFDVMVDDFSSATLSGTLTGGKREAAGYVRVLVDNEATGFPSSPDAAIYKMATGNVDLDKFEGIGFKIRLVKGTIDYSNLVLGLRGGDTYQVYEINLSDAVDPDAEELNALKVNEFVDVVVSPQQSIEDADTVYKNLDGTDSELAVLSDYLGFHLYAKGEMSAILDIAQVYLINAGEKTVLDEFNRDRTNDVSDGSAWWRDSTGFINRPHIELNSGASYETKKADAQYTQENLVLRVAGNMSGLSIATMKADGTYNTPKSFADLKDANNASLKNAVNGAYNSIVINLANSGLETENVYGFKLVSTTDLYVSQIFMSNLQEKEAAVAYPSLDSLNAKVFDAFTRVQSSVDATYDAGAANTTVTSDGMNYTVGWAGASQVSVDGDALVITGNGELINYVEGSKVTVNNEQYLIFVSKMSSDFELSKLRIKVGSSEPKYVNDWVAGASLPSIPADFSSYEYIDEDGYAWIILDLYEMGLTANAEINIFYDGVGSLTIDNIFYANAYKNIKKAELGEGGEVTMTGGYQYLYGGYNGVRANRFEVSFVGDGTATLESFRVEVPGASPVWANSGKLLKNADGTAYDYTQAVPVGGVTLYIDLAEAELEVKVDHIHFHFDGEGASGTLIIGKVYGYYEAQFETPLGDGSSLELTGGYVYKYAGYNSYGLGNLLITFEGDGTATLESFRVEVPGASPVWANSGKLLKNLDGTAYDYTQALPEDGVTLLIDFAAAELEAKVDHIHFHFDGEGASGTITYSNVKFVSETAPATWVLSQFNDVNPLSDAE